VSCLRALRATEPPRFKENRPVVAEVMEKGAHPYGSILVLYLLGRPKNKRRGQAYFPEFSIIKKKNTTRGEGNPHFHAKKDQTEGGRQRPGQIARESLDERGPDKPEQNRKGKGYKKRISLISIQRKIIRETLRLKREERARVKALENSKGGKISASGILFSRLYQKKKKKFDLSTNWSRNSQAIVACI